MAETRRNTRHIPDGYMSITQAAGVLGVCLMTLDRLAARNQLPKYVDPRNPAYRLVKTEDVERIKNAEPVPVAKP